MDLRIIWFILIAVLFIGFFFLEGFDFGVGVLLLLLGKTDEQKRVILNTIGPFWDGNEVWLITAGGAIFAAFPIWYATMFSGFYLALLVILVAIILRGVGFEFRSKNAGAKWRRNWDYIIFGSSAILSILWGVAFANLIKGVPIDSSMNYVGTFSNLISIYTLVAGVTTLLIFMFHGAIFLSLKAEGVIGERAIVIAKPLGICAIVFGVILTILTYFQTKLFNSKLAVVSIICALMLLVFSCYLMSHQKEKIAMISNGLSIALSVTALFLGLFPAVMISSIKPEYSLTITNASSSANTLLLMTKIAIVFVPIVLAYQIWSYYIFRKRVTTKDLEY